MYRRHAEALYRVVDEHVRSTDEAPVLAAHRAPHQGAVPRAEFLHAAVRLNDFGTRDTDAALFRDSKRRAAAGNQSATPVTSSAAANEPDHFGPSRSRFDQGAHDFGNRQLARIGLLQSHAAGIK